MAQDIASGIRTGLGDCWYDTTIGVDYPAILGKQPPIGYVKAQFLTMAKRVPTVESAKCYLSLLPGRGLGGQVIAMSNGVEMAIPINQGVS